MTENGLIIATHVAVHGWAESKDTATSQLTVKNDNWPDTGVSKSIEDSCE